MQEKSFHAVARHLVKEVISPNENVRKQVRVGRQGYGDEMELVVHVYPSLADHFPPLHILPSSPHLPLPPSPHLPSHIQSHHSLLLLANITGKSVTDIMDPHREILADMIPPKKHLLKHQPVSTQIALMEGNTFCTSLKPRLFSINLTVPEHKIFFQEVCCDDVTVISHPISAPPLVGEPV